MEQPLHRPHHADSLCDRGAARGEPADRGRRTRRPRRPRVQRAADGLSRGRGGRAQRVANEEVETTWASSLASFSGQPAQSRQLAVHEGMLFERHRARCTASQEAVFDVVCALGGDAGWPAGNALWQLRGLMDRMVGGVGMRRGRRHPRQLRIGEPLDFWRVEALEPPHLLRLRAEMKLPGTAWLQFEVLPDVDGARIEQTAFFDPHGLPGYLYWYAVRPFHRFVFPGLIRAVRARAESGPGNSSAARGWTSRRVSSWLYAADAVRPAARIPVTRSFARARSTLARWALMRLRPAEVR